MKLATLGDSHLGSLKRAWDRISSEFAGLDIVFFGARGDTLKYLQVEGQRLVPTSKSTAVAIKFTSTGYAEIDLSLFDAVLIYGCKATPFFLPSRLYSKQARHRAMTDLASGLYFDLLQMIRSVSPELPVYIGHEPLLAMERKPVEQSFDAYQQGLAQFNKEVLQPMRARMIAQPPESIVNGNRTDIKYSQGSRRLAIGDKADDELHPERDLFHMNDEYGEAWLRKFFSELKLQPAASVNTELARPRSLRPRLLGWLANATASQRR